MDMMITGRIRSALPGLVDGIRKASESAAAPQALLTRVLDAAPTPEVVARMSSGGMAASGALAPPPPLPPAHAAPRSGGGRSGEILARTTALAGAPGIAADPARSAAVDRLGKALELLDSSVREQQDLIRRGRRDLC